MGTDSFRKQRDVSNDEDWSLSQCLTSLPLFPTKTDRSVCYLMLLIRDIYLVTHFVPSVLVGFPRNLESAGLN